MDTLSCQKCRMPLRLDDSLQNLNAASFDLLTGPDDVSVNITSKTVEPSYPTERHDRHDAANQQVRVPMVKRSMGPARRGIGAKPGIHSDMNNNASAMSFIMLSDSQLQSPSALPSKSHDVQRDDQSSRTRSQTRDSKSNRSLNDSEYSTRLFDVLSARSDIDHPLCVECTELTLNTLRSRLSDSLKERDAYASYLKGLRNTAITPAQVAASKEELASAKDDEESAFRELIRLEGNKNDLEEELAELDAQSRILDLEEEAYWKSKNAFDQKLASLQDSHDALNVSLSHDIKQLSRLERTNVYNDTFFISHDGPFGTINGLRLGRLPPPNHVDWPEINAAWGTTALLLATVAARLKFTFRGYVIVPLGSTSRIDRIETPQNDAIVSRSTLSTTTASRSNVVSLELFSSGDLPLGRQILHRRFNEAMVAFLECLKQLCEHTHVGTSRTQDPGSMNLPPYRIERDKINGVSIKLGVSQDDAWTTACKYTLTCCKFLLAHISNIS